MQKIKTIVEIDQDLLKMIQGEAAAYGLTDSEAIERLCKFAFKDQAFTDPQFQRRFTLLREYALINDPGEIGEIVDYREPSPREVRLAAYEVEVNEVLDEVNEK